MASGQHPLQRCAHFIPGLRNSPWWNCHEFPAASNLEHNFEGINAEFLNILLCGHLRLHPQSKGGPRKQIADGDWSIFELFSNGRINAGNAVLAPQTVRILKSLPELTTYSRGLAYFSVLSPRLHIAPHCGPTNSRIRIHLGLLTPKGAKMRVGRETRTWIEGQCVTFDDSWEHEVFNASEFFRAVLLLDVRHPDLAASQLKVTRQPLSKITNSRRRKERAGWLNVADLTDASVGPSLRSLLGDERLSEMIASASRDCISRYPILFALQQFASQSLNRAPSKAMDGPPDGGTTVCREFWSAAASLIADYPAAFSTQDVINLIHLACVYWRSAAGAERNMRIFMDECQVGTIESLFHSTRNLRGVIDVLRWCDAHGRDSAPFAVIASAAATAIRKISNRMRLADGAFS